MENKIDSLKKEPVFRQFYRISQIPHGSGQEQALSNEIIRWARERNIQAECDAIGNVFLKKKRSWEKRPAVLLQAHMDMVCVKRAGSPHDFDRDPIPWVIEGDVLSTGGETSLGADDGIGVALALAMLELDGTDLPDLEVLLTVNEEEDMSGALGFDMSRSEATLMINLDHTNEHEILCGSCGGMRADLHLPVEWRPVPDTWTCCELILSGLAGGHSGDDIHKGRGNAIVLLARLLDEIGRVSPFGVCKLRGGSMRLAIPAEAEAVICFPAERETAVRDAVNAAKSGMARELSGSGADLAVKLRTLDGLEAGRCVESGRLLDALLLSPDGICQMNASIEGMVDTSDNLGEVLLGESSLDLVFEIRSAQLSLRFAVYRKLERLAALLGGNCSWSEAYPSWEYRPGSRAIAQVGEVYREVYGGEPRLLTLHAGLEPGCLIQKKPDLDVVSLGPTLWDLHSPGESLSISSVRRFYVYLQKILITINQKGEDG
ncbi:MAG: beta-Ala-His dipeptidase [Oscillospiraceae bacterium]|nr:beta-Ala-His dipeptidase [Oscillospiraceae bacterium]